MNFKANKALWTSVGVGVVIAAGAIANTLTIPNTFTPHTPALAAQVNENFLAVKTSVDDNATKIAALQAQLAALQACPTGTSAVGSSCVETASRTATDWTHAATNCAAAGGSLCPVDIAAEDCRQHAAARQGIKEMTNYAVTVGNLDPTCVVAGPTDCNVVTCAATSGPYAYRCCFRH